MKCSTEVLETKIKKGRFNLKKKKKQGSLSLKKKQK